MLAAFNVCVAMTPPHNLFDIVLLAIAATCIWVVIWRRLST